MERESTKEKSQFDKNMKKILYAQLASETYNLLTKEKPEFMVKLWKTTGDLRRQKELLSEEEKIKISNEIIEGYDKLFEKIGKEKFCFYDEPEGYVEYIAYVHKD